MRYALSIETDSFVTPRYLNYLKIMKHIKLFKKKLETNIELDLDENLL
jgi:hypothetical protein